MQNRRENYRQHVLDNNGERRRWMKNVSTFRFLSINLMAACAYLWTMSIRHSFLLQLSPYYNLHRRVALENQPYNHSDLAITEWKLTIESSLQTFEDLRTNTPVPTAAVVEPDQIDHLATTNLPQWMKGYFTWHKSQLQLLNETNWKQHKFLILACTKEDGECGGLADRLKPLPLILAVAQKTNRIVFIRWTRPFPLEEFLLPLHLNWSIPEWLSPQLQNLSDSFAQQESVHDEAEISDPSYEKTKGSKNMVRSMRKFRRVVVWEVRVQDIFGGCSLYEQVVTNSVNLAQWKNRSAWNPMSGWHLYKEMYHDLFRTLFVPTPPIQRLIHQRMTSANLIPGNYTTAHYRAFYAIENQKHTKTKGTLRRFARHAVDCAAALRPGVPIYFASDSKVAIDTVREYASNNAEYTNGPSVITFANESEKEALHLDKAPGWKTQPSDYYATFVDILIMSNASCISYGQGGFGLFAALMSRNANCTLQHSRKKKLLNCTKARFSDLK
ncbi:hypothetical protein IV203_029031 [Nitzschia inconspicua]|uniref:Uncharacterized protein n=1 Tax=Nitzschia inconspicua TaxID=303405 RepID=A0A9K3LTK1_9STRA|nr:hypothetical protein IV203_029031 [Nitzschia inconspicua]